MLPRSRAGRIGLHLLTLVELVAAVALFVALGFALGPGIIAFTAVMTLLAFAFLTMGVCIVAIIFFATHA
jgi:hypothetical protein